MAGGTLLTGEDLALAVTGYVVLLFSLSVHESAHAWMAHRLGDDTALSLGRVSLNPLVHIDPIGTVLIPIMQFLMGSGLGRYLIGWAKPTPYNPANFRRDRTMAQGHILVAAAGPVSNLLLAVLFTVALYVALHVGDQSEGLSSVALLTAVGVQTNVSLAVFNFVPIPPLDGSKVASWGLPRSLGEQYDRLMEPYGYMILLVLYVTGVLRYVISPITSFIMALLYSAVR